MPHILDIRAIRDDEAHAAENLDCFIHHLRNRMMMSNAPMASRKRHINRFCRFFACFQLFRRSSKCIGNLILDQIQRLANRRLFLWGDFA